MSDGTLPHLAAIMAAFQVVLPAGTFERDRHRGTGNFLHPAAAGDLVAALEDATQHTQVLLTTHSTELLAAQEVHPSQVLVVRRPGRADPDRPG